MSRNTAIILLVVILAILGIWYFAGAGASRNNTLDTNNTDNQNMNDMDDTDTGNNNDSLIQPAPITPGSSTSTTQDGRTVKSFTMAGSNFKYSVPEIRVKRGETVKITYSTISGTHDLRVDGYNVGTQILRVGDPAQTFEFVADKAGTFEYFCSVGSHRQMGMVGKLIVE